MVQTILFDYARNPPEG